MGRSLMTAHPPFRVGFGNTVKGRDPSNPTQEKTVCQAYGYSALEAAQTAQMITEALNKKNPGAQSTGASRGE